MVRPKPKLKIIEKCEVCKHGRSYKDKRVNHDHIPFDRHLALKDFRELLTIHLESSFGLDPNFRKQAGVVSPVLVDVLRKHKEFDFNPESVEFLQIIKLAFEKSKLEKRKIDRKLLEESIQEFADEKQEHMKHGSLDSFANRNLEKAISALRITKKDNERTIQLKRELISNIGNIGKHVFDILKQRGFRDISPDSIEFMSVLRMIILEASRQKTGKITQDMFNRVVDKFLEERKRQVGTFSHDRELGELSIPRKILREKVAEIFLHNKELPFLGIAQEAKIAQILAGEIAWPDNLNEQIVREILEKSHKINSRDILDIIKQERMIEEVRIASFDSRILSLVPKKVVEQVLKEEKEKKIESSTLGHMVRAFSIMFVTRTLNASEREIFYKGQLTSSAKDKLVKSLVEFFGRKKQFKVGGNIKEKIEKISSE